MKKLAITITLLIPSLAHAQDASKSVSEYDIKAAYNNCRTNGVATGLQSRTNPNYKPGYESCAEIDKEYNRLDLEKKRQQSEEMRQKDIKAIADKIKGNAK